MLTTFLPEQMQAFKLGASKASLNNPDLIISSLHYDVAYSRILSTNRVAGQNDICGDCVQTGCLNVVQTLLANKNNKTIIPNELGPKIYSAVTGYNPNDPSTDKGTDIDQMFSWWKENVICDYKLKNVTEIHPQDEGMIRRTIEDKKIILFIMTLSLDQQNQKVWTPSNLLGTWGNHLAVADGYDGPIYDGSTWGILQPIDRSFFNQGPVKNVYSVDLIEA